mmetsp:Transcript_18180/g.26667  ORF Transcript_18180/g.26667 Transcript_18180/m.26667 type:complete len:140 (-) Transcript_18180:60-479(-)
MEFVHWCRLSTIREQELKSTKESLKQMTDARNKLQKDIHNFKVYIQEMQQTLPLAIAVVFDSDRAIEVQQQLRFPVEVLESVDLKKVQEGSNATLTPADEVRCCFRCEGLESLTIEEKKWCLLDSSALHPEKWTESHGK